MTNLVQEESPNARDASTRELVATTAEQISRLVRDELTLARAEMTDKARRAGLGAGLFGGSGVVTLYGVAALLTAGILGLAEAMPAWLAALIVAVVLFATAGVLAAVGRIKVNQAVPPVPQEAIRSIKADIDTVREKVR